MNHITFRPNFSTQLIEAIDARIVTAGMLSDWASGLTVTPEAVKIAGVNVRSAKVPLRVRVVINAIFKKHPRRHALFCPEIIRYVVT